MGKRPQQTLSSEDTQMANKYMKSRSTSFDIRGFQTKQQRDATTHVFEWPKSGNRGNTKCWRGRGITGTLVFCHWVQSGCSHFGRSLAVSYKTKHAITMWSNNCTLGHLSQRNKNLCSHKTWTRMLTVALSVIMPNQEQLLWLNSSTMTEGCNGAPLRRKMKRHHWCTHRPAGISRELYLQKPMRKC